MNVLNRIEGEPSTRCKMRWRMEEESCCPSTAFRSHLVTACCRVANPHKVGLLGKS